MTRLSQNELIGTIAIQTVLENSAGHKLPLAKLMLVLPLIFDRSIRSALKRRNGIVLSSKDLIISNPSAFSNVRSRFEDLTIISLNTIVLSQEMGMTVFDNGLLSLRKAFFSSDDESIGKMASEIFACGPKISLILQESVDDLYQTFRIEL